MNDRTHRPVPAAFDVAAIDTLSDQDLQAVMARAMRAYAARVQDNSGLRPYRPEDELTATEVMLVAGALLEAAGLQVFELGLWQSWISPR